MTLATSELMTPDDICAYLKVTRRTLQMWVSTGKFPQPSRLGYNTVRWRRVDIETHLNRSKS